jgi:predicted methyltransferase
MTVVELFPGGLASKGRLVVTGSKTVAERIEQEPAVFGKVTLNRVDFASGDPVLAPDASADLVVEHRAKPGTDAKTSAESGYVTEETVIDFAKKAGFEVEAKSEINANPNDTKDHQGGVWVLPPSFANGDADQAKYAAIGESDRMTIRFKKP